MKNQKLIDRFIKLEGERPLDYLYMEKELNIKFSNEFKELSEIADFEYLAYFDIPGLLDEVVKHTQEARESVNLPQDTLYLAEDDASLLFMKCCGDHEEIYWMAIEDGERYCNGEPLLYDHTIFKTFPEFFEYLLDEEEKSRAQDEIKA